MSSWTLVLALAVGSYVLRYSLFGLVSARSLGTGFDRALQWVVPAVLGALLGPSLVPEAGSGGSGLALPLALVVALAVVSKTRREIDGLAVGLPVLWTVQLIT